MQLTSTCILTPDPPPPKTHPKTKPIKLTEQIPLQPPP